MGTSSADPDRLDTYLSASAGMAEAMRTRLSALASEYDATVPRLQWGYFNASATIGDLVTWMRLNDADDRWLGVVSAAFAAADRAGLSSMPDEKIAAALTAAGVAAGPRQDLTVDDPVMAANPPTSGYANDPVCTATGHLVEIEPDLPMPFRAGPLGWVRTYTSRWRRPGPFGRGWATWASCALTPVDDGVELLFPDGKRAVYSSSSEGRFHRVSGVTADLTVAGAGHELRYPNGDTWVFDADGRLTAVTTWSDRVDLERDGAGRLLRMVHDHGRVLELHWTGDRVTGVESSDGRSVAYAYDSGGDLVEAVLPGGVTRTYLQAGEGLIASCVDADGVAEFVNTYDGDGRVLTQVLPFGRTTDFRYVAPGVTVVADRDGGPVATYLHDPAGRLVGVVDDHDAQLHRTFDEWGNLAGVTDRTGASTVRLHDPDGRLLSESDAAGSTWSWRYDDAGRLVETVDALGALVRLTYDGSDRQPSTVTDALGAVTRCEVADGEIVRVTDPDGVVTVLERDSDGLAVALVDGAGGRTQLQRAPHGAVTAVTDAAGGTTAVQTDDAGRTVRRLLPTGGAVGLEWSTAGRLVAATNPAGGRSTIEHGGHGEVVRLVDASGVEVIGEWNVLGRLARISRPDGACVEHTYDGLGRLVSFLDPTGAVWVREHDAEGRLTALVDPAGRRQERTYDALGRVAEVDDGAGVVTRFGHDRLGRVVQMTDGTGATTTVDIDPAGRQVARTDPEGATTRWAWTPGGRLRSVTTAAGRVSTVEYDAAGRPSALTGADGEHVSVSRDAAGRIVARTTSDGAVTVDLDAAGRVVGLTTAAGASTTVQRDPSGRVTAVADPLGAVTGAGFDPAGRLVSVTDPLGNTVRHEYDPYGLLATSTGPDGAVTSYLHDAMGRLAQHTDPTGATTAYERDLSGRPTAVVDPTGTLAFRHDDAGRVVGWTDRAGVSTDLTLDPAGRVLGARSGGRAVRFSYDRRGLQTTADHGDGRLLVSSYDADGRRLTLTRPDGSTTRFERDGAGRVVQVSDPVVGVTSVLYGPGGRPRSVTSAPAVGAAGMTRRYDWSDDGLLTGAAVTVDGTWRALRLERDAAGRVVAAHHDDGSTSRWTYDLAGQLVAATGRDGTTRTWTYVHGRRTGETGPDGVTTHRFDAAGRLLDSSGAGDGGAGYTYDRAGRRTAETGPAGTVAYGWDGMGRLASVRRTAPDGRTTSIRLDVGPLGDLEALTGPGGDEVALTWDTVPGVSELVEAGGGPVDLAAPPPRAGDAAADPFRPATAASAGLVTTATGDVVVDRLVWLRARVYDPSTGQFLTPDPLPHPAGHPTAGNPYAYAGNDPVGHSDPLGLTPMSDADLAAYRTQAQKGLGGHLAEGAQAFIDDPVQWVKDHGDALLAAGLIIVGGVLIATGVGAPIGVGIIIGATLSMATQVVMTGDIDARQVWISAALGGVSGGVGAGVSTATTTAGIAGLRAIGIAAAAGAGTDGAGSAIVQYATTGHVDPTRLAIDTAIGGVGAGVGGALHLRGAAAGDTEVPSLYHTTTSKMGTEGVLSGIDPQFLNPSTRFGKAFYVSDDPETTLAELAHHNATGTQGIRFDADGPKMRVLDLTDPATAQTWGYAGGESYAGPQGIAQLAAAQGYNTIKFPSLRGPGTNYAILGDFNDILSPQMVTPVPSP